MSLLHQDSLSRDGGQRVSELVPEWLDVNSPLQALLFNATKRRESLDANTSSHPCRIIATRDSEVFAAFGTQIRCADLKDFKAREGTNVKSRHQVLDLPQVHFEIKQLEINTDGTAMIVTGESSAVVCVLPRPGFSRTNSPKIRPQFVKTLSSDSLRSGSKIVRALWHPMGAALCAVLVTDDSVVQLFEVEVGGSGKIVGPSEVWDLNSLDRDGQTGGIYLSADIEPTSACFGSGTSVWSPLTLYILMEGGDVYAICPLVPQKWAVTEFYMEEFLRETRMSREYKEKEYDTLTDLERYNLTQEVAWMRKVGHVYEQLLESDEMYETGFPDRFVLPLPFRAEYEQPVLQGPFLLQPSPPDFVGDIPSACDIVHLSDGPLSLIAILYANGRIDILTEFEEIHPRWISKLIKNKKYNDRAPYPILSGMETIKLKFASGSSSKSVTWPVFSMNRRVGNALLINHDFGIEMIDLDERMESLNHLMEEEDNETALGAEARHSRSSVLHVITSDRGALGLPNPVLGSSIIDDPFLGRFVFAVTATRPAVAILETEAGKLIDSEAEQKMLQTPENQKAPLHLPPLGKIPSTAIFRNNMRALASQTPSNLWRSKVMIGVPHQTVLDNVNTVVEDDAQARWNYIGEVYRRAKFQREALRDQLDTLMNCANMADDMKEGITKQEEKIAQIKKNQENMNKRLGDLSKRLALSAGPLGYTGLTEAEEKWVKEVKGADKLLSSVNQKIQAMKKTVDQLLSGDDDKDSALLKPQAPENTGEESENSNLSKLLSKEQKMIQDLRHRLGDLELRSKEIIL